MRVEGRGPSAALQMQARWRLAAAFATGASLNVAFAPFGWWPIAILAPAALFALIRGLPPRRGETIQVGALEFRVLRADRRRIDLLRVITPTEIEPPAADESTP